MSRKKTAGDRQKEILSSDSRWVSYGGSRKESAPPKPVHIDTTGQHVCGEPDETGAYRCHWRFRHPGPCEWSKDAPTFQPEREEDPAPASIATTQGDEFPKLSEQVYAFADLVASYRKGYAPHYLADDLLEKYKVWHPDRPIVEPKPAPPFQRPTWAEDDLRGYIEVLEARIVELESAQPKAEVG